MSVTKKSHIFDKVRGIEIVIITDSHGREHHIHVPALSGIDADAFIQKEMEMFADTEAKISQHIASRFHPETLERLK